ncbi:MAG: OmpA family protein [Bdellovibrionota bacterium]
MKKFASLDASSPEYASTAAQIDGLLKALGGAQNLTEAQKKALADQTKTYEDRKAAVVAASEKANRPINPETIDYTKDGEVTVPSKLHVLLKDLGFGFTDEGQPFEATALTDVVTDKKGKKKTVEGTKNISPEEVDQILEQLAKKLEGGSLTPEKLAIVQRVLEGLKDAKGVDQQKIEDFLVQHDEQLHPMNVKWTPEQLAALANLDSDASKAKPGLTEDMKKWSKGFPDQATADSAKKTALEKVERSLLIPKDDFSTQEREAVVDELKKTGFVNEDKAEELKAKIGARGAFVDAQGNYHPEYAFLITLVKASRPDGSKFSAFKFNSTINFETGSAKVDANGENVINGFLNFVKTVKETGNITDTYFRIEAFTDATGSKEKNQQVSNSRAQSVKKHIVEKTQTPEENIIAVGKGIDPEALNGPKVRGKYQPDVRFRRVEITFSSEPFTPKVPS